MRALKTKNPPESRFTPFQAMSLRALADQAFCRAAGATLIPGNRIELLKDAGENYPAWIRAMESATEWIHFESYIIHDDDLGVQFAELMAKRAREGIKVRLIYDWAGSLAHTSAGFWRRLSQSGVDVRCFNPPRLGSPFGWISRDHRKMLAVDGRIAFVAGLCVGRRWAGYPDRGIEPWRDTGVAIEGPAVGEVERAFADTWAVTGLPLPGDEVPFHDTITPAGDMAVRIVATVPNMAGMYRLDQLVAALARRSIWLSDAYFAGTSSYVQSLRAAALEGVDVRLLVPGANDIPVMRALSRAGFRPLLEAGVRVYEWNGPMMHAKTAVADGRWARVGSTNLNLASWIGNWELDVIVENDRFARTMEQAYLDDLSRATEIVLGGKRRRRPIAATARAHRRRPLKLVRGSTSGAATGVMRITNTVGAAITSHRELGPAEAIIMVMAAAVLIVFSIIALYWPRGVVIPIVVLFLWSAISLLVRAYRLRSKEYG